MHAFVDFAQSLPPAVHWLGILALSAIPFVESYFGSAIGVLTGMHPVVAIGLAVVGNAATMLLVVMGAAAARRAVLARRRAGSQAGAGASAEAAGAPGSKRRARVRRMFDRWGVPGVSLLGQCFLPSQITSGMMVSFGASRNAVIGWQLVSIVAWGVVFGALAAAGVRLIG